MCHLLRGGGGEAGAQASWAATGVREFVRKHGCQFSAVANVNSVPVRPEECFRLPHANIVDDAIDIHYGKTESARRRIPMTARVKAILEIRAEKSRGSRWIFPARTKSGHIEKSSLRKQHATALQEAKRLLREQTGNKAVQFENFDYFLVFGLFCPFFETVRDS
jgi:hypothetical protein